MSLGKVQTVAPGDSKSAVAAMSSTMPSEVRSNSSMVAPTFQEGPSGYEG